MRDPDLPNDPTTSPARHRHMQWAAYLPDLGQTVSPSGAGRNLSTGCPIPQATATATSIVGVLEREDAGQGSLVRSLAEQQPNRSEGVAGVHAGGRPWRVAVEANDCVFHLELSPLGAGVAADRVIVELPQDEPYAAVRRTFLRGLASRA
jgi:hypothetical protein